MSTALLLIGCGLVACSALGESAKPIAWKFWAIGVGFLVVGLFLTRWS